jgi:hypothetical protein
MQVKERIDDLYNLIKEDTHPIDAKRYLLLIEHLHRVEDGNIQIPNGTISEYQVLRDHDNTYYIGRMQFSIEHHGWFAIDEDKNNPRYGSYGDAYCQYWMLKQGGEI